MAVELAAEELVGLAAGADAVGAHAGDVLGLVGVRWWDGRGRDRRSAGGRLGRARRRGQGRDEDVVVRAPNHRSGGRFFPGKGPLVRGILRGVPLGAPVAMEPAVAGVEGQDRPRPAGDRDQRGAVVEEIIAPGQRLGRRPGPTDPRGGVFQPVGPHPREQDGDRRVGLQAAAIEEPGPAAAVERQARRRVHLGANPGPGPGVLGHRVAGVVDLLAVDARHAHGAGSDRGGRPACPHGRRSPCPSYRPAPRKPPRRGPARSMARLGRASNRVEPATVVSRLLPCVTAAIEQDVVAAIPVAVERHVAAALGADGQRRGPVVGRVIAHVDRPRQVVDRGEEDIGLAVAPRLPGHPDHAIGSGRQHGVGIGAGVVGQPLGRARPGPAGGIEAAGVEVPVAAAGIPTRRRRPHRAPRAPRRAARRRDRRR